MKASLLISLALLTACSTYDPAPDEEEADGTGTGYLGGKADSPNADAGESCACGSEACAMLELVNAARAEERSCGSQSMVAVPKLYCDVRLETAAARHALDMANNDFFAHQGSDGSTVAERVSDAGFEWWTVGENIAAGQTSPEETLQSWLDSPGHCLNIMKPDYGYFGSAHVTEPESEYHDYWVQVFAGL